MCLVEKLSDSDKYVDDIDPDLYIDVENFLYKYQV